MASVRNYMTIPELLEDYNYNRRRWGIAAYERAKASWTFLCKHWDINDPDLAAMQAVEGRTISRYTGPY